jgi:hypothetical protein
LTGIEDATGRWRGIGRTKQCQSGRDGALD